MTKLDVNGIHVKVAEEVAGEPVVFVHGSASDYRTWRRQLDEFRDRYRVIAYSRRCHWPNDPIPDGADYSMVEHVDDLQALLHSLVTGVVHLVGHSYGAFVALLLAIREPRLVRSLVLAEPPAITLFVSSTPKPWELLRLALRRPRTAAAIVSFGARGVAPATSAARRGNMEAAMRIFGNAVLGPKYYRRLSPARREQVDDNAIAAEFLGSGFAPLHEEDVRGVDVPVLLVGGTDSPPVFRRVLDRLEELLPRTQRVWIGGASHIMHEDNAADYNAAVRSFLATH